MPPIKYAVPLAPLTTFGIGGEAAQYVEITTEAELVAVLAYATEQKLPVTVLGGGSNVLIGDAGVEGLVIKIAISGRAYRITDAGVELTAGAGEVLDAVVADTVERGYWGLENLSHIPGLVGAAPIQNVGAYGVEVGDCITAVTSIHIPTGEKKLFTNAECQFAYRDSIFKTEAGKEYIVTSVTFSLSPESNPQLTYKDLTEHFSTHAGTSSQAEIRDAVIAIRSQKFPNWHELGTAGSFFKNPIIEREDADRLLEEYPDWPHFATADGKVKFSLSWFLDKVLNLKGVQDGGVGTYEKHVLVMVHHGGATAADVAAFAEKISAEVFSKTKIKIVWEVTKLF